MERAKELKEQENNNRLNLGDTSSRMSRNSVSSKSSKMSINKNIKDILLSAKKDKISNAGKKIDSDEDIQITPIGIVNPEEVSKSNISVGSSKKSSGTNQSKMTIGGKKVKKSGITLNF